MKSIEKADHISKKERDSAIELFRIITMLVIVAHHYIVNSGIMTEVYNSTTLGVNTIFALLFGWGGKTGINCFVLITGYFMCKSKITLKKFLKLLLMVEFYRVVIYFIFIITGYQEFGLKPLLKAVMPITYIGKGFTAAYLVFYLFIPFLNILVGGMNKRLHQILIALCVGVYTVLPTLKIDVTFNYVTWFSVIYIIGAYIRMYPEKWFDSKKLWGVLTVTFVVLSWLSVIAVAYLTLSLKDKIGNVFYFVSDSNKILALLTAVSAFMYFKNLKIGYSKLINTVAASAFGVLLIHSNSDTMRRWLWKDVLNNVEWYHSDVFIMHAILSVIGIYIICTIIDVLRIKFVEKPLFKWIDKLC